MKIKLNLTDTEESLISNLLNDAECCSDQDTNRESTDDFVYKGTMCIDSQEHKDAVPALVKKFSEALTKASKKKARKKQGNGVVPIVKEVTVNNVLRQLPDNFYELAKSHMNCEKLNQLVGGTMSLADVLHMGRLTFSWDTLHTDEADMWQSLTEYSLDDDGNLTDHSDLPRCYGEEAEVGDIVHHTVADMLKTIPKPIRELVEKYIDEGERVISRVSSYEVSDMIDDYCLTPSNSTDEGEEFWLGVHRWTQGASAYDLAQLPKYPQIPTVDRCASSLSGLTKKLIRADKKDADRTRMKVAWKKFYEAGLELSDSWDDNYDITNYPFDDSFEDVVGQIRYMFKTLH